MPSGSKPPPSQEVLNTEIEQLLQPFCPTRKRSEAQKSVIELNLELIQDVFSLPTLEAMLDRLRR